MMLLNGLDTYSLYVARKSRNSCVLRPRFRSASRYPCVNRAIGKHHHEILGKIQALLHLLVKGFS